MITLFIPPLAPNLFERDGDLRRTGAYNGRAKLEEDDVRAIRALRQGGMSLGRIGKRFGVSKAQVLKIERRQVWAHIP